MNKADGYNLFLYPVLLYLRQMLLDLIDASGIAGVRAHKFGSGTGFAGGHLLPEIDGDFRVSQPLP